MILIIVSQAIVFAQIHIKEEINLQRLMDEGNFIFNIPEGCSQGTVHFWWSKLGLRYTLVHPSIDPYSFLIYFVDQNGTKHNYFGHQYSNCYLLSNQFLTENAAIPPQGNCLGGELKGILYNCSGPNNPVLIPLIIEPFFDDNKLFFEIRHGVADTYIGTIWYEPLVCGTLNLCSQPFNPPELNIDNIPNPDICKEITDDIPAGAFKGLYWELREGEEFVLTPCQDQMTGNIKFKYATNFTTSIDVTYNLELCPDRIAYLNLTRIDGHQEFSDYLTGISDKYKACELRTWIIRHSGIDANGNQTGGEILFQNGIWLTASTLAHEEQHRLDYEKELNDAKNIFDQFYIDYSISCSTYLADPENAELVASNQYLGKLYEFSDFAQFNYEDKLNEVELNGRSPVQESINLYLESLDKFIKFRFGSKVLKEILDGEVCQEN
jgi:hypothetical protein